jgi:hypothetical protein
MRLYGHSVEQAGCRGLSDLMSEGASDTQNMQ